MKQWDTSAGAYFYEFSMQALVHLCQKYVTRGDFAEK